jgi:hypothetical protein
MFTFPKHHFDPGFIFAGFVSFSNTLCMYLVGIMLKTTVPHCSGSASYSY